MTLSINSERLLVTDVSGQFIKIVIRYKKVPASILYKSIAGRYRPVRVADGPITARYRFIKNASRVGYNRDILPQTASMVVNLIIVDKFVPLLNCTTVSLSSD